MKRTLRNILLFVVSAACAGACTHASAQTAGFNAFGSWAYEWANGQVRGVLTGPNGATTAYPMGPSAVGQTVANGSGGVTLSRSAPVALSAAGGNAASATLTAVRTLPRAQLALSVARGVAQRTPWGLAATALTLAGTSWNESQQQYVGNQTGDPNTVPLHTPFVHNSRVWIKIRSSNNACGNTPPLGSPWQYQYNVWAPPSDAPCDLHSLYSRTSCPSGQKIGPAPNFQCVLSQPGDGDGIADVPLSETDLSAQIDAWLQSNPSQAPAMFDQLHQNGGATVDVPSATISGPASVTSPSTVQTTPAGSRTTSTTYNITYQGNSYSWSSVNNTTVRDAAGNVTGTESESNLEKPEDVPVTVSDTAMPGIPQLYERKYPDGIVGVWNTRKSELQETGFSGALASLMPDIPDGTGCPQFSLPGGNIAGFAFPGGNLGPPCWVWPWVKVVIVITSLFLARSLIFGG